MVDEPLINNGNVIDEMVNVYVFNVFGEPKRMERVVSLFVDKAFNQHIFGIGVEKMDDYVIVFCLKLLFVDYMAGVDLDVFQII